MKNTKIVLILLMASAYGHAQQQPNFLFFEQNMGLYNPAATGIVDQTNLSSNIRSQLQGRRCSKY